MRVVLSHEQKRHFIFYDSHENIAQCLLWHTGKSLSVNEIYNRETVIVLSVFYYADEVYRVDTMSDLQSSQSNAWYQHKNVLYIKFASYKEPYPASTPYFLDKLTISVGVDLTDDYAIDTKYGILSHYTLKRYADFEYGLFSYPAVNLKVVKDRVSQAVDLVGSRVNINVPEIGTHIDSMIVTKASVGHNVVGLELKDIRASFQNKVCVQQFKREDYTIPMGSVLSPEMVTAYKKETVGRVNCVVGQCLNGYAFDNQNYRLYRFGYGDFTESKVEIERSDGFWEEITIGGAVGKKYTTRTVQETRSNGEVVTTKLLEITTAMAYPSVGGVLDYDREPARLRVSGDFGDTEAKDIIKYFFNNYSEYAYNDSFFNTNEINIELADMGAVGICISEPMTLGRVIESLQKGCKKGFQLCVHNGKFTARTHDHMREVWGELNTNKILDFYDIIYNFENENVYNDIGILYQKCYTDDEAIRLTDSAQELSIKSMHRIKRSIDIETLLNSEIDAKERLFFEGRKYLDKYPEIEFNIYGSEYFGLRQYDIVNADLDYFKKWVVVSIESDIDKEITRLKLRGTV